MPKPSSLLSPEFRYHNSASHADSSGLRFRFSQIDSNWNRSPAQIKELEARMKPVSKLHRLA